MRRAIVGQVSVVRGVRRMRAVADVACVSNVPGAMAKTAADKTQRH